MKNLFLFLFLLFFLSQQTWGQSNNYPGQPNTQEEEWMANSGYYAALFTGKEQMKYPVKYENHPFFMGNEIIPGSISYDGVFYPSVGLRWDMYRDELVAVSKDRRFNIILVPDRMEEANLDGFTLVYLDAKELSGIPRSGYYLSLYNNKYRVLEKREAEFKEKHEDSKIVGYFRFSKRYYIRKGNGLFPVKGLSGILKLFPDMKKELKSFSKRNKLDFRTSPEIAIPAVVQEYERVTLTEKQ